MHAGDITAALPKTLDFSPLSEFLVGTGVFLCIFDMAVFVSQDRSHRVNSPALSSMLRREHATARARLARADTLRSAPRTRALSGVAASVDCIFGRGSEAIEPLTCQTSRCRLGNSSSS